jgi:D-amino-acid dehydrogenase
MVNHLKKAGVLFKTGSGVDRVVKEGNKIKKVVTSSGEYEADTVVMAAGSWLPELTKMAGVSISLMPGKGYSFTLKQPEKKLNVPAILCEARVAITPMNGLMRYGGTMEIGKVNDKVNMNRVEGIVEGVNKYFPNINLKMPEAKDIWYGFRPCTPDGLPYIGYSKKVPNLLIAGGHAMSGLSLGPATGKIVSELANGQKPSVKIDAFAIGRFN